MVISKMNLFLRKAAESINIFAMVLLAFALFTGVISRYVFSASIPEIEVIRKFCIMWLVFIGSAIAIKDKQHLEIDILSDYLSERMQFIKSIIVYVLTLVGTVILLFIGYAAFQAGMDRTELVSIRFLPFRPALTYYYSAFLVGSILMVYFHLTNIKQFFNSHKNEVKKP